MAEVHSKRRNCDRKGIAIMPDDDQGQGILPTGDKSSTGGDPNQAQQVSGGGNQMSSAGQAVAGGGGQPASNGDEQSTASQTPAAPARRFGNPLATIGRFVANMLHGHHPNLAFQPLP